MDDPRTGSLDRLSRGLGWSTEHLTQRLMHRVRDAEATGASSEPGSLRELAEVVAVMAMTLVSVERARVGDGSGLRLAEGTTDEG